MQAYQPYHWILVGYTCIRRLQRLATVSGWRLFNLPTWLRGIDRRQRVVAPSMESTTQCRLSLIVWPLPPSHDRSRSPGRGFTMCSVVERINSRQALKSRTLSQNTRLESHTRTHTHTNIVMLCYCCSCRSYGDRYFTVKCARAYVAFSSVGYTCFFFRIHLNC